jgi:DNA-3-methyladenine glycosylase
MSRVLERSFYERPAVDVAKDLIGKVIVRNLGSTTQGRFELTGRIVEVEAYGGFDDPASHAFHGKTKRNSAMFEEAGHAYVYFTYGNHHCLNFVTTKGRKIGAVLVRAVEPLCGIKFMQNVRKCSEIRGIASGPGKLCQAMLIDRSLDKVDVTQSLSPLFVICDEGSSLRRRISCSSRIGISKATKRKWRFFEEGSPFLSR